MRLGPLFRFLLFLATALLTLAVLAETGVLFGLALAAAAIVSVIVLVVILIIEFALSEDGNGSASSS